MILELLELEVIAAFELQLSKENVFPLFGSGDNFSSPILLRIVTLSKFRICWPVRRCAMLRVELSRLSLTVFR
jgi:hypothetical protein